MPETRTDFVVQARALGFSQVQAEATKLSQAAQKAMLGQVKGFDQLGKSTDSYKKEVKDLENKLGNLMKQQLATTRAMEGVEKGTEAYKELNDVLKNTQEGARKTEQTLRQMGRAFRDQRAEARGGPVTARQMARGGMLQGIAQGAMPGLPVIQRGPGMRQQMLGMGIGRAARGVGSGLLSSPFSGASGIAQAMSSLPGGGFAAQPLMQTMQRAGMALQQRQAVQGAAPFLGGIGLARERGRALQGFGEEDIGMAEAVAAGRAIPQSARAAGGRLARRSLGRDPGSRGAAFGLSLSGLSEEYEKISKKDLIRKAKQKARTGMETERDARLAGASSSRSSIVSLISTLGADLMGVSGPQAIQSISGMMQGGGGTARQARRQGMIGTGMAAQTLFGIGGETAGAFLQGGRRGGLAGGKGRGGEAMVDAIRQGMSLGLEGSELTQFMSEMAAGITEWKSTGIPINPQSISDMGATLGGLGLGGVRGTRVASGLSQAARGLSQRGPQTAAELMVMQRLGGFKGGGAEDFESAQLKLEQGGFGGKEMRGLLQGFMQAGGGGRTGRAIGRATFRGAMRGLGINVGVAESRIMEKQLRGEPLSDAEQAKIQEFEKQQQRGGAAAPAGVSDIVTQARALIDPALRRQAEMANSQIDVGQKMITSMQNLEASSNLVQSSFSKLAPHLDSFTGKILEVTSGLTAAMESLVDTGVLVSSGG